MKIKRALLSVFDKTGLIDLAKGLAELGIELVSTGGTARTLKEAGLTIIDVADVTGFPEMMDGRVKTLHPKIHGGLLAVREDASHQKALAEHGIPPIDLLVSNLYPFGATVSRGASYDEIIENIDIGGPAMTRAAAKSHTSVSVIIDPNDYKALLSSLRNNGGATTLEERKAWAAKAFASTAAYDAAISNWFARTLEIEAPPQRTFTGRLKQTLRYGENPHQKAAFYSIGQSRPGVAAAEQVQGKALSYNNIADTDAAYELIAEFPPTESAAVAIIKHANPCGVATAATLAEAYRLALRCDSVSAFGGIIALNRTIDGATAEAITEIFTEVIIAPDATDEARAIIAKKKNLRLLLAGELPDPHAQGEIWRSVSGGMLVQTRDNGHITTDDLRTVTQRAPTPAELKDLLFAWRVCKHVKSNAVVYAKDLTTTGIGMGQTNRLDSARSAALRSEDAAKAAGLTEPLVKGSVVASEAFFPFADGLLTAAAAGATAIIQPGGAQRDDEVIQAADEAGLAMVFTGMRHFRH